MRQSGKSRAEQKFFLLTGAALAAAMLSSSPALAQQTTDQTAATADDSAPAEEIVVNAQHRTERLEDVPISITNVSSDTINNLSLGDVMALPQAVPSLRITRAGTFVQPSIRGIGSQVALPGLPQNVTTYIDGFYVPTAGATDFDLVNVSSVNVLKGPQGTLFGFNTTGGAIQITTRTPEHDPSAMLRVGYGEDNHISTAFYGTTGLTDALAADLAISYENGDGFMTNVVNGNDHVGEFNSYNIRTKFLLTPAPGTRITLALAHSWEDNPGTQNVVARDGISIATAVPGAIISTQPEQVSFDHEGWAQFLSSSITLTGEFDLGFATLTSYSGYREDTVSQGLDYDASSAPLNFSYWRVPDRTATQEFDLASNTPENPLSWVVGAFYMRTQDNYDYNTNGNAIFDSVNTTFSKAVFADGTYRFGEKLYLTLGARYTWDNPRVHSFLYPFSLTTDASANFSNLTGRAVLRYEIDPGSNVYASYTQGYKAGALPASSFSPVPIRPEHIDAYEVGYKTFTGPLRFDAAAFYYDYRDIQTTAYGAGGASITVNAAQAESYGIDGSVAWDVTPDFAITLGAGLTHARYTEFPNATGFSFDDDPLSPTFGTISLVNIDATGKDVQRTPSFSGNLAFDYGFQLAGGRMALNANIFYTGKFNFDVAGQLPQDAYSLVNLRATWTDPSEHYDISVFGTNVTDETYFVSSFADPYAVRSVYGDPQMWGVSLTIHTN